MVELRGADTEAVYTFRPDVGFARRADGVALYSPSSGRGTVVAGVYADLLVRALESVGSRPFAMSALVALSGAGTESHWTQLVENLVARGLIHPSPHDIPTTATRVLIAADGLTRHLFSVALEHSPLGAASVGLAETADWPTESVDVVVSVGDGLDTGAFRAANERCVDADLRYLPVRLGASSIELGPLVIPGLTACFDCLWWRQELEFGRSMEESEDGCRTLSGARLVRGRGSAVPALAVATVLAELGRVVGGGPGLPDALGRLITVRLEPIDVRRAAVLRLPDCPTCGGR